MLVREDYQFYDCKEKFLQHLRRMEYSYETIKGYEKDLQLFYLFIKEKKEHANLSIDNILKEDLVEFIDFGKNLGHATNTIARRLSTIKSFYKFLVNELDYPIDLAARIKLPKVYIPLRDILTELEIKMLLEYTAKQDPLYHLFFSILYYTGSRLTPVRMLERKNVLIDQRIIYFPKVKGGKDLYLPIHDKLLETFNVYLRTLPVDRYVFSSRKFPTQPVSAADVRLKLKRYTRKINIGKNITPHSIRHSTATHLTIRRVDQRTIASILGHSDLRSTMRYQHLAIEHLRNPINVL